MIATMPSILFDDIIRFGFDGVGEYRNESPLIRLGAPPGRVTARHKTPKRSGYEKRR
jgi:hypothetical protein